jgi:site-specific recombinase XerC
MNKIINDRMSVAAKFMTCSVAKKKGGTTTRTRMKSTFNQLQKIAKSERWNDVSPQNLTHKQFSKFIQIRMKKGLTAHSIQTDVSAIRRALEGAGRRLDCIKIFDSKSLGVPSFSRSGTGVAIDKNVYEKALEIADQKTASLMRLQRDLGLRMNEALAAKDSLLSWLSVLEKGGLDLRLTDGSKGGRPRTICIHKSQKEAVVLAIKEALIATENGKKYAILEAKNPVAARQIYTKKLAEIGLKNEYSSHSLRRAFACDQYHFYIEVGYSEKNALSLVSNDLGHGDGRGRWVWNNYIKNSL